MEFAKRVRAGDGGGAALAGDAGRGDPDGADAVPVVRVQHLARNFGVWVVAVDYAVDTGRGARPVHLARSDVQFGGDGRHDVGDGGVLAARYVAGGVRRGV